MHCLVPFDSSFSEGTKLMKKLSLRSIVAATAAGMTVLSLLATAAQAQGRGRGHDKVKVAGGEVVRRPDVPPGLIKKGGLPPGQAMLFWLKDHMPRTAEKVLSRARARWSEH